MSVKVYRDGGIVIEVDNRRVLVDPVSLPRRKPDVVFVSHAHSDHARLRPLRVLSKVPKILSRATKEVLDPRGTLTNVVFAEDASSVEVAGLTLETYEAGHVVGSLQLAVNASTRVVYTGDFCLERRLVLRPARILRADALIIDATYGHPRYSFPPRPELYRRLLRTLEAASSGGVLFAARPLGTGQELTAVISLVAKLTPFVARPVGAFNRLYERYGEYLGSYVIHPAPPRDSVAVVPLNDHPAGAVVCTGWAVAEGVPLSSHADFDDVVRYAVESRAQTVFTFSAHAKYLAAFLRREYGVEAHPVESDAASAPHNIF